MNSQEAKDLVGKLSALELRDLGKAVIDRMESDGELMKQLSRCPVCNKAIRNSHSYSPSWRMTQIAIQGAQVLNQGHKHFHVKPSIHSATGGHENHTLTGEVRDNLSKMLYLDILTRCLEDGSRIAHFSRVEDRDELDGKNARFTLTQAGYNWVMGTASLKPGRVTVREQIIIEQDENAEIVSWVKDVDKFEEDAWDDGRARCSLSFPGSLLNGTQTTLFGVDE